MTTPYLADNTDYGNAPGQGSLRPGGVSLSETPNTEDNLPSTPSPSAKKQSFAVALVRDLWDGNEKVRERGTTYLPQAPGEDPQNYSVRKQRSVFFNVFRKTVEGLTGFVFAKDPVLGEDVPPQIATDWENIDNAGTHGDVFARQVFSDALTTGHAAILVEYPATGGTQTYADEKNGIRPYWVPIRKEDILSWRTVVENGKTVLTQLVLQECRYVPKGSFGEVEQKQYRVFYRQEGVVGYELLQITDKKVVIVVASGMYPTQEEIPVAEIVTSGRQSLFESTPPLIDLAYLNIAHYQQWSDQATSIHKTCVPIWVETGVDTTDEIAIVLGPNSMRRFSNPDAEAGYKAHDGGSLTSVAEALQKLTDYMATLGLSMLSSQKRAAETATAKQIDKASDDSALAVSARGLQDGLERCLGYHAKYRKLEQGGSVTINRDFENKKLTAEEVTAWVALVGAGLPQRFLVQAVQTGGWITDEETPESISAEMEANAQAKADQEAQAAQDQLQMQIEAKKAMQPKGASA